MHISFVHHPVLIVVFFSVKKAHSCHDAVREISIDTLSLLNERVQMTRI
jgi:hypothetical protein